MYTIADILKVAGVATQPFASSGVTVRLSAGNQLLGSYAQLLKFRAADPNYRGWEVHHIFEALDVTRLGYSPFSPGYDEQICVILPAAAHHRINSILRRENPTSLSATTRELDQAYGQAYALIDNYCGSSAAQVRSELLSIFRAVLSNLQAGKDLQTANQLMKGRHELDRLARQIALQKGLHAKLLQGSTTNVVQGAAMAASMLNPIAAAAAFINPANRSTIGAAVNLLNPAKRPELSVWNKAEQFAQIADQALGRRDMASAASALGKCEGHFRNASAQLEAWRDGIPLAGRRAELSIGAAAMAAVVVAVAVYAIEVVAVGTASAAATTAAGGEASTGVRIAVEGVEKGIRVITTAETLAEEQAGEELVEQTVKKLIMRQ